MPYRIDEYQEGIDWPNMTPRQSESQGRWTEQVLALDPAWQLDNRAQMIVRREAIVNGPYYFSAAAVAHLLDALAS
jgi:non-ribosomal peptide synthetase component E (peptide arylation enzyme)